MSTMEDKIPALLSLTDIRRHFTTAGGVEVQALRGISLDIHAGEFVSIVGQSGSGKSTLMNIIGCLDRASSGEYKVTGRNIETYDADSLAWLRREAFGFVFQSYNLLNNCNAIENVEIPAIYAGLPSQERHQRASELLQTLGLGDRLDHRPNQLSGGQQQRVSIARALMNGGRIILADEPTGALDSQSSRDVMELLKELAHQGHTVIIITHDMEVAEHTERIIELKDGRIINDRPNPKLTQPPACGETNSADDAITLEPQTDEHGWITTLEAIQMAFRSLHSNVFRTFLTLLGIVIGVSSVVAMLAIGEGAKQRVIDRISSMGTNMITVRPSSNRGAGQRGGESSSLTIDIAENIAQSVPNVIGVLPEIQGNATVRVGNMDYRTTVTATTSNLPDTRSWSLARGIFFNKDDNREHTPVAVLGKSVYDILYPDGGDPLGDYMLISNIPFQIIGVMSKKGSSGFGGRDQDDVVFVPLRTGGLRVFGRTYVRSATVAVSDASLMHETEALLLDYLQEATGSDGYRVFNSAELLETASDSQEAFTLLLGSVAAISLLVGGIGVMNIMLVSVSERTREIGIRMATGARQSDILKQFLAEAIVVSCVGGIVGILFGVGVGKTISLLDTPVVFSIAPMVAAFICAAGTGLVFGFAPARKAARLDPVVALAND